ncbi:MAG TPA: NB-ARC domain-containing protein [Nostocaceae cyanobacterium]|nr:NB-ARC domain-containing protein [Nostocaceae cyanobacterium]
MSEIPDDFLSRVTAEYGVSEDELTALRLALAGQTAEATSKVLSISTPAVRKRLHSTYDKFGIKGYTHGKLEILRGRLLEEYKSSQHPSRQSVFSYRLDKVPDVAGFHGRKRELSTLSQWLLKDDCRLVALLGMGGIGKTALAAKLVEEIQDQFECIIWRNLANAPGIEEELEGLIDSLREKQVLSNLQGADFPKDASGRIAFLLSNYLQNYRLLIVLDNLEAVLQQGDSTGSYRKGYEGYGELLKWVGQMRHQSCILLTSREKPKNMISLEGSTLPVRSLVIEGLEDEDAREILVAKDLIPFTSESQESELEEDGKILIRKCGGHPFALKLVAATIQELFDGNIAEFLSQGIIVFDDICALLEPQFERLSELEKQVMYWLAINRESVSVQELQDDLLPEVSKIKLLEALKSLVRRSLISTDKLGFTQHPLVMEYMIRRLVEQVCEEIDTEELLLFDRYPLVKADVNNSTRKTQIRLILSSVADKLSMIFGSKEAVTDRLKRICSTLQEKSRQNLKSSVSGYAVGNIINLLIYQKTDLKGLDFSNLSIRHGYFQAVDLPFVNFTNSDLVKCVFTQTFSNVISVAFSADGKLLAASDASGQIYVWNITEGAKILFSCHGHTNRVWSVAFSLDGQTIASGSDDHTVRIWNAKNGRLLKTFHVGKYAGTLGEDPEEENINRVFSVSLSRNGSLLASSGDDHIIRIWDVHTGEIIKILSGHTSKVMSAIFSPDGQAIASCSEDKSIRIWDISTGEHRTLEGHSGRVWSVAFNSDGSRIASGGEDKTAQIWDTSTGHPLQILEGHTSWVMSVIFLNEHTLASCSDDRSIRLWNVHTGECIKVLEGHSNRVWSVAVAFNRNRLILASGSEDRTVRLWDYKTGECISTLQGYVNRIWAVAFSPGSSLLASGSDDHTIRLWDVHAGECIKVLEGHTDRVWSVAFSPDGSLLASGSSDLTVRIWDVRTGECISILSGHSNWVWSVAFSSDNQTVASASDDQEIRLWNAYTGEFNKILQRHTSRVWSVAFSPNGSCLASGGEDKTVRIWNVHTGKCIKTLKGHKHWIRAIAFSHTGHILASASEDKTIRIWDTNTGKLDKILEGHTGRVRSICFSSHSSHLVSGSEDKTVRIWNVHTGKCLKVLEGHTGWIGSVAFDSEGSFLASSSEDETIRIWDVGNIEQSKCLKTLSIPKPYQQMNITGLTGLKDFQKQQLIILGAVEC